MYSGTGAAITVSINKKAAEQDLKELEKSAEGTGGRIGDKGGGKGGIGGGLVGGLGRAMGKGYSLGKRAAHRLGAFNVLNDITTEGLSGVTAAVGLGLGAHDVRAKRRAMADTIANYTDFVAHASGDAQKTAALNEAHGSYFAQLPGLTASEKAKDEIIAKVGGWGESGADLAGPLDRMTNALVTAVGEGFGRVNGTLLQQGEGR